MRPVQQTLEEVIARADTFKAAGQAADAARLYEEWIDTLAPCGSDQRAVLRGVTS